jgi:hypothetical protein
MRQRHAKPPVVENIDLKIASINVKSLPHAAIRVNSDQLGRDLSQRARPARPSQGKPLSPRGCTETLAL